jgi:hypothetical protein
VSPLETQAAEPGARWLASVGFAPPGFTARFLLWPLAAAFGAGLLIALAGAWLASRRAARVRPAEALREAAIDRRVMPVTRWLAGLAALGGSVPLIVLSGHSHSGDTAALFLPVSMLLTLGFAMLAPVLIRLPTIGKLPGVSAAVPVADTTVYVDGGGGPDNWAGEYVPGPALPRVKKLPLVELAGAPE